MSLRLQISEDMKTAMRAKDSARLSAIRLLLSAMKQREVDERIELDDTQVIEIIEKMLKQRRDSISQYEAAKRTDLADVEKFEVQVLSGYLPQALTEAEIAAIIEKVIADTGAAGVKDMGKVMGLVKAQLAGKAEMSQVSAAVKAALA